MTSMKIPASTSALRKILGTDTDRCTDLAQMFAATPVEQWADAIQEIMRLEGLGQSYATTTRDLLIVQCAQIANFAVRLANEEKELAVLLASVATDVKEARDRRGPALTPVIKVDA